MIGAAVRSYLVLIAPKHGCWPRQSQVRRRFAPEGAQTMNIFKTAASRFANLPDFANPPHYADIGGV